MKSLQTVGTFSLLTRSVNLFEDQYLLWLAVAQKVSLRSV